MTPEGIELVARDRAALVSFYNATGGSSWYRQNNWNTHPDLKEGQGVAVNRCCRVVKLYLPNNNLQGKIGPLP